MNTPEFQAQWRVANLTERASSQSHFLDVYELVGHQKPAALDRAVWAAYGWDDPDPAEVPDDVILVRLLALNLERAAAQTIKATQSK